MAPRPRSTAAQPPAPALSRCSTSLCVLRRPPGTCGRQRPTSAARTSARAARRRASPSSGRPRTARIWSARRSTSQKSTLRAPRDRTSATPEFFDTMTGTPCRIASSAVSPNGSLTDGMTYRSAIRYAASTSGPRRNPANRTWRPRPMAATCSTTAGPRSPHPAMMNRTSCRRASTRAAACTKNDAPFCLVSRPRKSTVFKDCPLPLA